MCIRDRTYDVTVEVDDTYNLGQKISVDASELDWSSADTSIATVNSSGKLTAKKRGTVYINASGSIGSTSYDYYFYVTVERSDDDDDDDDDDDYEDVYKRQPFSIGEKVPTAEE